MPGEFFQLTCQDCQRQWSVRTGGVLCRRCRRREREATAEYLHIWENDDAGERRYGDEFSVDEDDTEAMSNEWRLAYVAAARRQDTWVAALLHPRTAQDGTVAPSTKSLPSCLSG
jgi:hypothetical protein